LTDMITEAMEHTKTGFARNLQGQPALVTGGSSGIGKATSIGLGKAGADVVVNYIGNADSADETAHIIEREGGRAIAIQADVSKEDEVQAMFKQAISHFGTLHIVVSNAGLQADSPFESMTLEKWNKVIGVNLTGQFLCMREAVREFSRRGVVKLGASGNSLGGPRELRRVQGRHQHADAKRRAGGGAAKDSRERDRAGRNPHADQHLRLEHAGGVCRVDETGALWPDRRAG
jgi:NAD(P)-dependent dehydrogenase (short-subunit alcohol dehydrogenase family)